MMKTSLYIILFLVCLYNASGQTVLSGGTENDIIGRIVKLPDTRLFAVVERNSDWGSGDFYGKFSTDDGDTWGNLIPIVTDAGNQSTFSVIVTPDDSLRLFYASDETGQYKIYTISSLDGINWSGKKSIDLGWSSATGVYDPQLIVEDDSSLVMVYIKLGGGAYVAHYTSIQGWDQNMQMIQNGAFRAGICKFDGKYVVAYHRNIGGSYDVHIRTSVDLISWNPEVDLTSNGNSHDPYIGVTENNELMVFYAKVEPAHYNIRSQRTLNLINWESEIQYTNDNTNNTQPGFFTDQNKLYLFYTHAIDYNTDNDIYFERIPMQTNIDPSDKIDWYCYVKDRHLAVGINIYGDRIDNLELINMNGQKIFKKNDINSGEIYIPLLKEWGKILIIKLITTQGNIFYKSIIN